MCSEPCGIGLQKYVASRSLLQVPDLQPIVTEIVKGGSYNQFYQTLHANIGQEPGWQQLAVMFKLTQSAVQLVGMGTAAALHIKEMSLQYFEDKFASWLIEKGGWVSSFLSLPLRLTIFCN